MAYHGYPPSGTASGIVYTNNTVATNSPTIYTTTTGTATSLGMTINGNLIVNGSIKQTKTGKSLRDKGIQFESRKHEFLEGYPTDHDKTDKTYKLLVDSGYLDTSKTDLTASESFNLGGTVLYLCYDTDFNILELIKIKHPDHKTSYKNHLYKDNFMINNSADLSVLTEDGQPYDYVGAGVIPSIPSVVAHLSGILNKEYSSKLRLYYANSETDAKFVTVYDKSLLRDAQRKFCGMYSYLKLLPKDQVYDKSCSYFNASKSPTSLLEFIQSICIPSTRIHSDFVSEIETQLSLNVRVRDVSTCASIIVTNLLFSNLDHV